MFKPFALFALLFACSPAGEDERHIAPLTITPEPEAMALAERAVELWFEASGIEIGFSTDGIPLMLKPQVFDEDEEICGGTHVQRGAKSGDFWAIQRIEIATEPTKNCRDIRGVVVHELGHVLCDYGIDGREPNGCHLDGPGLMGTGANFITPDEKSLELVCSRADCSTFNPL